MSLNSMCGYLIFKIGNSYLEVGVGVGGENPLYLIVMIMMK